MIMIVLNFLQLVDLFRPIPFIERIVRAINPFYLVNRYGLFSYMTTHRDEIVIEGSQDGKENGEKAYGFKWKPGELDKSASSSGAASTTPGLAECGLLPLGQAGQNPWLIHLIYRLLDGSPDVLKLLKNNPFPDAPRQNIFGHCFMSINLPMKRRRRKPVNGGTQISRIIYLR